MDMSGMDMSGSSNTQSSKNMMDMSMQSSDMSMSMTSTFSTNWSSNTVLFQQLKTSNPAYYVFALFILFVLAMLHEVIGIVSVKYDEHLYKSKKSQLDRKFTEEARRPNDEQFALKEANRLRQEHDAELSLKVRRSIQQQSYLPVTASSTLSPLSSNQVWTTQSSELKSPSNSELPRCCVNEEQISRRESDDEETVETETFFVEPVMRNRLMTDNSENAPINESQLNDKLQTSLEFASEHLKLNHPVNCQSSVSTLSTPLNGSAILTTSTSACATPQVINFRYTRREQINRTFLYFLRTLLMFILMILFMMLDVGFVMVILLGMSTGYFFYSNYLTSAPVGHQNHH